MIEKARGGADRHDAVVVGAGPAGLATSRELARRGVDHVVLERGDRVGYTWANLYDSLVLHTGRHLSALPGLAFPAGTPLFPTRDHFLDYLDRYTETFRLPVRTRAEVVGLERSNGRWRVPTADGADHHARVVIVATGIVSNPYVPAFPDRDRFRGRVIHSVEYRRPDAFRGERVLVVGAGNSAGEISAELAGAGARVTVAVRSGARAVPRQMLGVPIQYLAVALSPLPRPVVRALTAAIGRASEIVSYSRGPLHPAHNRGPALLPPPPATDCPDVPLIGFHLVDGLRARTIRLKGGVAAFTTAGVRFGDGSEEPFDSVILATGYQAAVGVLGDLIRRDSCGFASRRGRVASRDQPDLYFVGHNYDTRGGLLNIAQDARLAARLIGGGSA